MFKQESQNQAGDKTSNQPKEKSHIENFLENILRSSQGLEQGQKLDSQIELDQVSIFFARIASKAQKTSEGCQLLANFGIDTDSTEKRLKGLINVEKTSSSHTKEGESKARNQIHYNYRLTRSIERCEISYFATMEARWEAHKETSRLTFYDKPIYVNAGIDLDAVQTQNYDSLNGDSHAIQSRDSDTNVDLHAIQSKDAQFFAQEMREKLFSDRYNMIDQFIPILSKFRKETYGEDQFSEKHRIVQFITAIENIFGKNSQPYENESEMYNNVSSVDIIRDKQDKQDKQKNSQFNTKNSDLNEQGKWIVGFLFNIKRFLEHKARSTLFPGLNLEDFNSEKDIQAQYQNDAYETFNTYLNENPKLIDRTKSHFAFEHIWNILRSGLQLTIQKDKIPGITGSDIQKEDKDCISQLSKVCYTFSFENNLNQNLANQEEPNIETDVPIGIRCCNYFRKEEDIETEGIDNVYDYFYIQIINMITSITRYVHPSDSDEVRYNRESNDLKEINAFDLLFAIFQDDFDIEALGVFDTIFVYLFTLRIDALLSYLTSLCTSTEMQNRLEPSDLIDVKKHLPVILAHLYLIFYSTGFYQDEDNKVSPIIYDFVQLLPQNSFADVALSYLLRSRKETQAEDGGKETQAEQGGKETQAEDGGKLIKMKQNIIRKEQYQKSDILSYVLSLDIKTPLKLDNYAHEFYKNSSGKHATDFIELVNRMGDTVDFLKIITLFGYYENAATSFLDKINKIDQYPIEDLSVLLEVATVLIQKTEINNIGPYLQIIYHCLLHSDSIDMSLRLKLIHFSIDLRNSLHDIIEAAKIRQNSDLTNFKGLVDISEKSVSEALCELLKGDYKPELDTYLDDLQETYNKISGHIDEILNNSKELYGVFSKDKDQINFDKYHDKMKNNINKFKDYLQAKNVPEQLPRYLEELLQHAKDPESVRQFLDSLFDPKLSEEYVSNYILGISERLKKLFSCIDALTRDQGRLKEFLNSIAGDSDSNYNFIVRRILNIPEFYLDFLTYVTSDESNLYHKLEAFSKNNTIKDQLSKQNPEVSNIFKYLERITSDIDYFQFEITKDPILFLDQIDKIVKTTNSKEIIQDKANKWSTPEINGKSIYESFQEVTKEYENIEQYLNEDRKSLKAKCISNITCNCGELHKALVEITKNRKKLDDFLTKVTEKYKTVLHDLNELRSKDNYGQKIRESPEKMLDCLYEITRNPTRLQNFLKDAIKKPDDNFNVLIDLNKKMKSFDNYLGWVKENTQQFLDNATKEEESERIRNSLSDIHDKADNLRDILFEIKKDDEKLNAYIDEIDKLHRFEYKKDIDNYFIVADHVSDYLTKISDSATDLHTQFGIISRILSGLNELLNNSQQKTPLVKNKLIENEIQKMKKKDKKLLDQNKNTICLIDSLINVAIILNHFESGNSEQAMDLVSKTPDLLPLNPGATKTALDLLDETKVKEIPAFNECVGHIIFHLSAVENENENYRNDLVAFVQFSKKLNLKFPFKEPLYLEINEACKRVHLF